VVCGRACVIGKSMLFRRAIWTGWRLLAVRNVLAEDYVMDAASSWPAGSGLSPFVVAA